MLSPLQKTVLLIAAAVLLFVVLCPATPTPTAVVKKQIVVGMLLLASAILLWRPSQPAFLFIARDHTGTYDTGTSILDLTCARLC